MSKFAAKEMRRQLYGLLRKHPGALLEFNDRGGMSIVKEHDEDDFQYVRNKYYLPLGHVDNDGNIHLISEE